MPLFFILMVLHVSLGDGLGDVFYIHPRSRLRMLLLSLISTLPIDTGMYETQFKIFHYEYISLIDFISFLYN